MPDALGYPEGRMSVNMKTTYICGPYRGTETGWAKHRQSNAQPCTECHGAHRVYMDKVIRQYGPGRRRITHSNPGRQHFCEDYIYLIMTGETNGEAIARRLGFTSVEVLNRYTYRVGLHPLHENPSALVAA